MEMESAEWTPDIVIRPRRPWAWSDLAELWAYRELVFFMVLREIQGRYRRTVFGVSWLLIRPALNAAVFSVVFGSVLKVSSDGLPYALFFLAGMAPWSYFNYAVTRAATSLSDNVHVISKVYFPRLVLPLASVISGAVDLLASLVVLLLLMLVYRTPVSPNIVWLPLFLAASVAPALAAGLWLAVLTAYLRDMVYGLTILLQIAMYASPVVYSLYAVPERWRTLYQLNPMVGIIQGTRWALLGSGDPPGALFALSLGLALLALVGGAVVFQATVRSVIDVL